jgi:hypothetical protein
MCASDSCQAALTAWSTLGQAAGTMLAFGAALVALVWEITSRRRERRRAQATEVAGWYDSSTQEHRVTPAHLINGSSVPVYQVVVSLVLVQGAGPREGRQLREENGQDRAVLDALPPGSWITYLGPGWAGMSRWPGIELAFTDAAGAHWLRPATGQLRRLRVSPLRWYGLDLQ